MKTSNTNGNKGLDLRQTAEKATSESLDRIRLHPFILEANKHNLTQEQALRWIMCAGRESRSFPHIIENMIERCPNPRVKEILMENLDDEYGNGNPEHAHFNHYLHLLDKLAVSRDRFHNYEEKAGIKLALSLAYNISSQESDAMSLGYMLVNEGMTQITYSAIRNGLHPYYPTLQTPFFALHVEVDEHHVEALYEAVDELKSDQGDDLLFGISVGERGMAVLLDEALGLFDSYTESARLAA